MTGNGYKENTNNLNNSPFAKIDTENAKKHAVGGTGSQQKNATETLKTWEKNRQQQQKKLGVVEVSIVK